MYFPCEAVVFVYCSFISVEFWRETHIKAIFPGRLATHLHSTVYAAWSLVKPEPEFLNLLRSPGIDSLVCLYHNPFWRTGPPGYIGWQNRFIGISVLLNRLQIRTLHYNFLCTHLRTFTFPPSPPPLTSLKWVGCDNCSLPPFRKELCSWMPQTDLS